MGRKEYLVICRGLPFECTDDDLKDFFGNQGIDYVDVPRKGNKCTGEATVAFLNEEDYNAGLKKNREYLKNRYIEVFPIDEVPPKRERREYRNNDAFGRDRYDDRDRGNRDPIIRLKGLPFSCTVRDVVEFFSPLAIVRDGVALPDPRRFPSGEAFVVFERSDSVKLAKQRHMKNIGHRYIEVFDASYNELVRFCDEFNLRVPSVGPPPFINPPPTGAYNGPQDYRGSQDNYRRGDSYPPRDDYGRDRGGPPPHDYASRQPYDSYQSSQPPAYGISNSPSMPPQGGYYDSPYPPPAAQPYDSYPRDPRPVDPRDRMPDPRDMRDPRDSYGAPDPRDMRYGSGGYDSSNWRGGSGGGGNGMGGMAQSPPGPDPYSVPVWGGSSGGGGGGGGGRGDGGGPPPMDRPDSYGYPRDPYQQREVGGGPMRRSDYGRGDDRYAKPEPYGGYRDRGGFRSQHFVLKMRGVPFRSSERDVYDFFRPVRPDHVELLKDNIGRPSGDARVIFYNRKDYDEALLKDRQYMGDRYIEMIPDNGRY